VPYPTGFYAKGWTGASMIQCRLEGPGIVDQQRRPGAVAAGRRQGMKPMVVHFQLRPDPLAH